MKPKGLGDDIEKFTKATGIKKLADKIPGGCGCQKRKETLNKMFPYESKKCNIGQFIGAVRLLQDTF